MNSIRILFLVFALVFFQGGNNQIVTAFCRTFRPMSMCLVHHRHRSTCTVVQGSSYEDRSTVMQNQHTTVVPGSMYLYLYQVLRMVYAYGVPGIGYGRMGKSKESAFTIHDS